MGIGIQGQPAGPALVAWVGSGTGCRWAHQNLDRTYPTNFPGGGDANAGRDAFLFTNYNVGLACTTCHTAPPGPGSDRLIIPAAALQESQDFKVPQLRAIYQKMHFNNAAGTNSIGGFGITHDGTDPSLQVFLSRPVFVNIRNDTTIKNNLAAFVQCFDTGTAPAVGYSRTLNSNNVNTVSITNDWALLENQALLTNIDLVVKGTLNGSRHGFWYQPTSGLYTSDSTKLGALTHGQLFTNVQNGDTITLMGVPVGSGYRMGIDRNEGGILDGDLPPPQLQIALTSGQKVLNWPYSAAGFDLEEAASLASGSWTNAPEPWEIIGQSNYVTNTSSSAGAFFRLHFQ